MATFSLSDLTTELHTDPATLGYAPFITNGSDGDLEALINKPLYASTGLIDVGTAQLFLFNNLIWMAIVDAAANGSTPQNVKDACNAIIGFCSQSRDNFIDPNNPVTQGILAVLVAAGLATSAQVTAFTALGAVTLTRAEVLWGQGTNINHLQIALAAASLRGFTVSGSTVIMPEGS